MIAKSIKSKSLKYIEAALEQNMADGFLPTIDIMFISLKQDRVSIEKVLHDKNIKNLGVTSAGEFIDVNQDEGSTVILLLVLQPELFAILFEDIGDRDLDEVSTKLTESASKKFKKPAFIHCSTLLFNSGEFGKAPGGKSDFHGTALSWVEK